MTSPYEGFDALWVDAAVMRRQLLGYDEVELPDTQAETVHLAVESARRWARRTDLSPELRLRHIWTVLATALEEA